MNIALCRFQWQCQHTFWKFLKVKIHFLLIFDLKTIIFPPDDAKYLPNICYHLFHQPDIWQGRGSTGPHRFRYILSLI